MDEHTDQLSDVKTNKWNSTKQAQRQFESAVRGGQAHGCRDPATVSPHTAHAELSTPAAGRPAGRGHDTHVDQRRSDKQHEGCAYCLDSPALQKHLIVAAGVKTYLALPASGSIVRGHCLIVPSTHVTSTLNADDDVWTEMRVRAALAYVCAVRMPSA